MKIILNGDECEVSTATVAAVLDELGYAGTFATALNGRFVPQGQRSDTPLSPQDRLEVIAPMQGG